MLLGNLVVAAGASILLSAPPGPGPRDDDGGCIVYPQFGYTVGTIAVSQETAPGLGDFDKNFLGYLLPYETQLGCEEFYGYVPSSYGGCYLKVNVEENRSNLYAVQTREGMSLMIIHDRADNIDGGSAEMLFELIGDPDGATCAVEDDPGDFWVDPSGPYTGRNWLFQSSNSWGSCCTDGMVLTGIDGNWSMILEFGEVDDPYGKEPISGLDSWFACSADGKEIELVLEEGRALRLEYLPNCPADLTHDGQVDICDVLELLGTWGAPCP